MSLRKQSDSFTGSDFRGPGGFNTPKMPSIKWLEQPQPMSNPYQPPGQLVPQPAGVYQQPPFNQQMTSSFGGFDPRTPGGFAQWATMLRPITEMIGGIGGMPALMAAYAAISGNQDWQMATTKMSGLREKKATKPTATLNDAARGATGIGLVPSLSEAGTLKKQVPARYLDKTNAPQSNFNTGLGLLGQPLKRRMSTPQQAVMQLPFAPARDSHFLGGLAHGVGTWSVINRALGTPAGKRFFRNMYLTHVPTSSALEAMDIAGLTPEWAGGEGMFWNRPGFDIGDNFRKKVTSHDLATRANNPYWSSAIASYMNPISTATLLGKHVVGDPVMDIPAIWDEEKRRKAESIPAVFARDPKGFLKALFD